MIYKEPTAEDARKFAKELIELQAKYKADLEAAKQTLRDHFAGLVMHALLSRGGNEKGRKSNTDPDNVIALESYDMADAMLLVREKKRTGETK